MSRIFIENLPKNINENELLSRFSQKGEITDVQLRKDKRNAFIGFKIDDAAKEAVDYFNKTFIHSSRISVKIAQAFRIKKVDLKEETTKDVPRLPKNKFDPFEEIKNDPEFGEFLQVQRNIDLGKGKQIWKDDVADNLNKTLDEDVKDESDHEAETEENEELPKNKMSKVSFEFTAKVKGLPYKFKKKQLKEFFLPVKPLSMRFVPHVKGIAYISFKTEKDLNQSLVKHRGFLDGHRIEIVRFKAKSNETQQQNVTKSANTKKEPKWKNAQPPAEEIGESGRIYVRNLSYTCTEDDLRSIFENFGDLTELHMPIDSYTKKPKGFAFVTFVFPEHAVKAFESLDKTDFQGRLLHLLPAHAKSEAVSAPPPPPPEEESEDNNESGPKKKGSSFKDKKKEEVKSEANNSVNWNTLFIRPNAVADIMSKKFNVNKIDLLTKSNKSDNVAVRMALGETQIVNEVRQFLTRNKVSLDSFSRGASCVRSNSVILVKNLPADTTEDEITELFQNFGLINRVILPPYGITAIVEMQEPNEAKFAFKKLAYSNFKHYPLYLEWAPSDIFDFKESTADKNDDQNVKPVLEELPEDNTTIFVKNLNFNTDEVDFYEHFAKIGRIYSATIAKKKTPQGPLSMGYGFVQYFKTSDASTAIKKLQDSSLNQHKLELKFSNRTANKPIDDSNNSLKNQTKTTANQPKQDSSKICVKNIPFEATVKDIQKLFSVYGQIKSVRLPKKLTGSSSYRGFGFVDFVSKEDAKRAFDALSHSTHLYGRPLVLEWAKSESNADDLLDNQEVKQVAAKTARYFGTVDSGYGSSSKRLKRSDLVSDLEKPYSSRASGDLGADSDD